MKTTINKYFSVLLISFCLIFVISCDKEENEALISNTQDPISEMYNLEVNDDGVLTFKNEEVFNNTVSELLNMESSELDNWEKQLNFTSYHSRLMAITEETESLDSEESVQQFAEKYSNFYYLDEHDVENKGS